MFKGELKELLMFSRNIQRSVYIHSKTQKYFWGFENLTLTEFSVIILEGFIENNTSHKHKWKTKYWY